MASWGIERDRTVNQVCRQKINGDTANGKKYYMLSVGGGS